MTEKQENLAHRLIRNFNTAPAKRDLREPLYDTTFTKLAAGTAASKLGAAFDIVAPGKISCPYHFHHAQEEMFIILEGTGTLRVAGEMLPLVAGDVIFIPPGPEYPHQILNTSNEVLKYLSVSTKDTPEVVEYPDSGKYLATVANGRETVFEGLQRTESNLDYWDGEP